MKNKKNYFHFILQGVNDKQKTKIILAYTIDNAISILLNKDIPDGYVVDYEAEVLDDKKQILHPRKFIDLRSNKIVYPYLS